MTSHQDGGQNQSERLADLRGRLHEIASRAVHRYEDMDEADRIEDEILRLEREISLSQGLETAVGLDWEAAWDGSSDPVALRSKLRTFLIYSYPERCARGSSKVRLCAAVDFVDCYDVRFGGPNDEVYRGQQLFGRGLAYREAHLIQNSEWKREIVRINSVHDRFDPAVWDRLRHYMFLFHDNRFECLAEDAKVFKHSEALDEVVSLYAGELLVRRGYP